MDWQARMQQLSDEPAALEVDLVELVLATSELSEDTGEISDRVQDLVASGRVRLRLRRGEPRRRRLFSARAAGINRARGAGR